MDEGRADDAPLSPVTVRFTLTRAEYVGASRRATLERAWIRGSFAIGAAAIVLGLVAG